MSVAVTNCPTAPPLKFSGPKSTIPRAAGHRHLTNVSLTGTIAECPIRIGDIDVELSWVPAGVSLRK